MSRVIPFLWERLPRQRLTIERRWCPVLMNNFQTRVLGSNIPMPQYLGCDFYGMTYPLLEPSFCSTDADLDALYDRAVERLESMAVVGTVERLSETVALIFRLIGLPAPLVLPEDNKASRRSAPSTAFMELIKKQNYYDFRLHKLAAELLDRKLVGAS